MPYMRKGKVVYHKVNGRWRVKQRCSSAENAKKAIRLLHMKTGH